MLLKKIRELLFLIIIITLTALTGSCDNSETTGEAVQNALREADAAENSIGGAEEQLDIMETPDVIETPAEEAADIPESEEPPDAAEKPLTAPAERITEPRTPPVIIPLPVLRRGDNNDDVRDLQIRLRDIGRYTGGINGNFGPMTEAAVKAIQTYHNLNADGIVQSETWVAIYREINHPSTRPLAATPPTTRPPQITQPPATEPPVTAPPQITQPPVTEPPVTTLPAIVMYRENNRIPDFGRMFNIPYSERRSEYVGTMNVAFIIYMYEMASEPFGDSAVQRIYDYWEQYKNVIESLGFTLLLEETDDENRIMLSYVAEDDILSITVTRSGILVTFIDRP